MRNKILVSLLAVPIVLLIMFDVYNTYIGYIKLPENLTNIVVIENGKGKIVLLDIKHGVRNKTFVENIGWKYNNEGLHPIFTNARNCIMFIKRGEPFVYNDSLILYNIETKTGRAAFIDSGNTTAYPSISPDGKLWSIYRFKGNNKWSLFVFSANNTVVSEVKDLLFCSTPSWNKNSDCLYFTIYNGNREYIIKYNIFNNVNVDTICSGSYPAISHDGRLIAYYNEGSIFTCDTLGYHKKKIVDKNSSMSPFNSTVKWSRNDNYIFYTGAGWLSRYTYNTKNLCLVNIDKKNVISLLYSVGPEFDCY